MHLTLRPDESELDKAIAEDECDEGYTDDRERIFPRYTCEDPETEDDESDEEGRREVRGHDREHDDRREEEGAVEKLTFILFGPDARELVRDDDDKRQFS